MKKSGSMITQKNKIITLGTDMRRILMAGCQWLMPVIQATQEAENRRIVVQSQSGQTVHKNLFQKHHHKKNSGREAQGVRP
jgi:hypothetical protein